MRNIEVVNYNNEWPRKFEEEKEKLEAVLKDELVEVIISAAPRSRD